MPFSLEDNEGLPWTASTDLGWMILIVALSSGTAVFLLALYLALWIRCKGRSPLPLYGFVFDLIFSIVPFIFPHLPATVAGVIALLDLIVWVVSIYLLRHEIQKHFREAEGWDVSIGPILTFFFSSLYINYCLNPVTLSHKNTVTSLNLSPPPAND